MTGANGLTRCEKCNQVLKGSLITPFGDDDDENDVVIFKEDGIEEETE